MLLGPIRCAQKSNTMLLQAHRHELAPCKLFFTGLNCLRRGWNNLFVPQVISSFGTETVESEEASDPELSDDTGDIEKCFQQLGYGQ